MDDRASAITREFHGDASLSQALGALEGQDDKALVIEYGGRAIRPGYHITEVKAGSFVTLDCGGNPDAWKETILQVEDLEPEGTQTFMTVGKFRSIMRTVADKVEIDSASRLTFEVGPPEVPMQIYDLGDLRIGASRVHMRLTARPAVCKPRHRESELAQKCCGGTSAKSKCC
jgi:hypothetical protein